MMCASHDFLEKAFRAHGEQRKLSAWTKRRKRNEVMGYGGAIKGRQSRSCCKVMEETLGKAWQRCLHKE
jgi:hypothetical protein